MKKIYFTLFLTTITTIQIFSQKCQCFDFKWKGNVAINIPVTLENFPYKLDMQFDLGAVTSVFYGNSIEPYLEFHPELKSKIDSSQTFYIQSEENVKLKGVNLKMGKVPFQDIDKTYWNNCPRLISR